MGRRSSPGPHVLPIFRSWTFLATFSDPERSHETVTYRSTEDALREKTRSLEEERARLEADRKDGEALAAEEARLKKHLEALTTLRTRASEKRALPMLDTIRIASPCSASWDAMVGDTKSRFCGACEKHVYDLSAMTREEAELLVLEREGELCVRLYRRRDGRVLTQDCPVGVRRKRLRVAGMLTLVAGVGAALAGFGAFRATRAPLSTYDDDTLVQGKMGFAEPVPAADDASTPHVMGTVTAPAPTPPPSGSHKTTAPVKEPK